MVKEKFSLLVLVIFFLLGLEAVYATDTKSDVDNLNVADLFNKVKEAEAKEKEKPTVDYYYQAGLANITNGMYKTDVLQILEGTNQEWVVADSGSLIELYRPVSLSSGEPMNVSLFIGFNKDRQVIFRGERYLQDTAK
ncbi:hypothetical protein GCM10009123_19070 [Kangiella japonica]|uniref:Uncharacterized protein n=1 Tax=Kangiella japonica TaxID=647384 RepID=A0ABN0T4C8_9GAMM